MQSEHDPYLAFRQREYRLYLCGWFVALVGMRIQGVALAWEVYQRTGEALALGLLGLVQAAPMIALALPAGYLADRFERRRVVSLSLLGTAATSASLAALSFGAGPVFLVYGVLLVDAVVGTLGRPARMALLPQIVPPEVFPNAVTWNSSIQQFGWIVGPVVGGFIVAWTPAAAYLVNAASSLFFVAALARVQLRPTARTAGQASLKALLAGLQFLRRNQLLLALMSLDLFAVLLGGATYLLPIYAEDILKVGPRGFGWLNAAPAIGAAVMALFLVYLPPMRQAGRALLLAVAGFGVVTIVFGVSTAFYLSLAMLALTGALDNISVVVRHTLIQLLTPDSMRGRVSAVNSVFISSSNQLGGFESGMVAHWFGPVVSVVSGGIGTILVVLGTAAISPSLRRLGALHEARPLEENSGPPAEVVNP